MDIIEIERAVIRRVPVVTAIAFEALAHAEDKRLSKNIQPQFNLRPKEVLLCRYHRD